MGKVVISSSMSLDGYGAGPSVSEDAPMGVGGERLHKWLFSGPDGAGPTPDTVDGHTAALMRQAAGAVVLGRRTFDIGVGIWGDVPFPAPSFVVTHRPQPDLPQRSGVFSFVPDPVTAVERARAASATGDVLVMGGPGVIAAVLHAGLADEILVQIAPYLFGAGVPLFPSAFETRLELLEHQASQYAAHVRYRVLRD